MHKLHELKETLCKELEEYAKRGSNLDIQSLSTIDTLAHAIKNIEKIISYGEGADKVETTYSTGWSTKRDKHNYYADTMGSCEKLIENAPDEQTRNELMKMRDKF